jgi:hypothetical protein
MPLGYPFIYLDLDEMKIEKEIAYIYFKDERANKESFGRI